MVIGTDCTGSCKSNYHTITTTTAPQYIGIQKQKVTNSNLNKELCFLLTPRPSRESNNMNISCFTWLWTKVGKQFHQYLQHQQSPHTSNNWTQKRSLTYALEIQVVAWDRHQIVAVLNRLMRSQPDNWISNDITDDACNQILSPIDKWCLRPVREKLLRICLQVFTNTVTSIYIQCFDKYVSWI